MPPPKTPAERVAAHKARQLAAGLVMLRLWVHADDAASLREHAAKLARRREKAAKRGP